MARFTCFFSKLLIGKKKRSKVPIEVSDSKKGEANGSLHVNHIDPPNPIVDKIVINESFSDPSTLKPELTSNKNLVQIDLALDPAYEGGDERDETLSLKRDYSDFDLQAQADPNYSNLGFTEPFKNKLEGDEDTITPELAIQSGHVSDPGMCRTTALWGSPVLNRSCSNIETKRRQPINSPTKSHSYNDLKNLSGDGNPYFGVQNSPFSAKSNCSADRVMLKKRSSSQVLPSRSRKLWWKLFLWSHRNIHKPLGISVPPVSAMTSNQKAGYSSDTLETFPEDRKKKGVKEPGNQWVAFAVDSSSPFDRINAWVNSIEETRFSPIDDDEDDEEEEQQIMEEKVILLHHTSEIGESSGKKTPSYYGGRRTMEETVQANNVIQSLSSLSSVAHISGMGLKVIPSISAFSSLRSVNLSGNFIVQINPGSLPRGLHTLDLSRNKIASIEGLRELTRLRILNLSYNRISRIGHGLSNCTLIKELYLAGNKISDVEGLHRLVKLTVLDLIFNKITTAKALGQLVANYNSLLAINLIGNPVQSNIGDDHLRKAVTSLLPHLTYLNKQTIKPQRAREAVTDSVAKAALGSGSSGSGRRRMTKRATQSSGLASSLFGGYQKGSQHISKRRHHHNHQHSSSTSRK